METKTESPKDNLYILADESNELKLRDKIAIESINGLLLRRDNDGRFPAHRVNEIGNLAYYLADEMIKHRNKT